ncbi:MAG TPA: RNA methyltransferase [Pyrinomonadaceae bacterium]|nr:RNA methyltransferase [Pyrinomonadaceae bacterium]
MIITSRDNSLLRQVRAVRDGKIEELIFIEGLRLCEEARRSNLEIEAVIVSEELMRKERAAAAIEELSRVSKRVATVSEKLLESVSYTKTPQGIIVLAQRPEASEKHLTASLDANSLLVVLHQINNPVNVGAILRTAEAAGATGVITTNNTSDPFSPKSLRGAMGSAFRLPIWNGVAFDEMIVWCRKRGIVTVCADVEASTSYTAIDWTGPTALVLGPESTGLTAEELESADQGVSIPMKGDAESLNVSVAAGILLFEAARQRREGDSSELAADLRG